MPPTGCDIWAADMLLQEVCVLSPEDGKAVSLPEARTQRVERGGGTETKSQALLGLEGYL